ncbi:hypothetical protein [Streptomyces sp. NPDC127066]|uniref:hypothetical protein n=1 Tax=Streptomyces sp. NPDC127066 TaxID=3347125 RepID=UPI00365EA220
MSTTYMRVGGVEAAASSFRGRPRRPRRRGKAGGPVISAADVPPSPRSRTRQPSNAFVPARDCWICAVVHDVAEAAWHGEEGLTLRHWLSVTASGMQHRMWDHGLSPQGHP